MDTSFQLRFFDHVSDKDRAKYEAEVARKLAPRYRYRKGTPGGGKRYRGPDPRGIVADPARHTPVWLYSGWQYDQAAADAFAEHVGGTLGALIAVTPRHNAIIAANPPTETYE